MSSESLNSVIFIQLPQEFNFPTDNFVLDASTPLPVQLTKEQIEKNSFNPADLTIEMILSGILTILAYDTENKNIEYYRHLLKAARPDIHKELTEAAILKARNEDYEIAEEIFQALRGYDPDDMITVLNSALFYDERGSSFRRSGLIDDANACDEMAKNFYQKVLSAETPLLDAFFNAGFFYLKQKNFSRARECFESYVTLTNTLEEKDLDDNGKYKIQRAKEILTDIVNRNLDDELFSSAYESILHNDEETALNQIREFLSKNPKVWNAWFMLGWALRRLEKYDDAKKAFEQALNLGGNNSDTYNELAICLLELGQLEECREKLYTALQKDSENTKIISNLGCLALKEGNIEEAKKFFYTVLEIDPDDQIAKKVLEGIE